MALRYSHAQGRAPGWLARDLRHSTLDGLLYTIMTGLVDTSLPVFTLWILRAHASRTMAAGLIQTLPVVIGYIIGLATPMLVRRTGGYRAVSGSYAATQVIACIGLAWLAILPDVSPLLLFAMVAAYVTGATAGGSSWLTWSGCFVPEAVRAHYVARRNLILHVGLLAGVCISALLTESVSRIAGDDNDHMRWMGYAFATLFLLGGVCRGVSTWHMVQIPDAREFAKQDRGVSLKGLFARLRQHPALRLLGFIVLAQFAVQTANPHWAAFAKDLQGFRYGTYFTLVAAMLVGKVAMNLFAGTLANRLGVRRTGIVAMLMLCPVPGLWLLAGDAFFPMMIAQFVAGAGLAVFDLVVYMMQLDHTEPHERSSLISKLMLVNNGSGLLGAAASAQVLSLVGGSKGFVMIFLGATVLRLVSTLPLAWNTADESTA